MMLQLQQTLYTWGLAVLRSKRHSREQEKGLGVSLLHFRWVMCGTNVNIVHLNSKGKKKELLSLNLVV